MLCFVVGVGLFRVNSRGNVVKFEDVDGLNVFCFKERVKGVQHVCIGVVVMSLLGNPPAFLQCGKWIFPLLPGKSPVLKASDCTYMFPELQEDGELTHVQHVPIDNRHSYLDWKHMYSAHTKLLDYLCFAPEVYWNTLFI